MAGLSENSRALMHAMTSSLLSRAVMLLAPLLIMPAMLTHLGSGLFGIWVTGTSIIALAAFMDFGIGNSLMTRLATFHGQRDEAAARRSIGAAYRLLGLVSAAGLGVIVIGWLIVLALPGRSLGMTVANAGVIAVMLLLFLAGLPLSIVYRALYANQQMVLYNLLQIASAAGSVIFTFSAIQIGLSPLAVVTVFGGVPILFMFATTLWYFGAFPQYRPHGLDFIHETESRALFRLGLGHLGLGILTAVGMNIDIPLILYLLDSAAVTDFALPSRIGTLLLVVVVTVFMPLWSINGAALARQEYAWVRRNTLRMSLGGGLIIAAMGVVLTLGIDVIMQLWVGQSFPDQALVMATMTLATTIIAVTSPYNMVLNAAGQVRVQIWGWAAFVAISVMAKVVLIPVYGAWIASAVTAVVYAVCITPAILAAALRLTRSPPVI